MKNKLAVKVIVPETYETFRFLLPESMSVEIAIRLIRKIFIKLGYFTYSNTVYSLLDTSHGMLLPKKMSLEDAGVVNGSVLIFIGEEKQIKDVGDPD